MCLNFSCYSHEPCRFGRGCIYAHSNEELIEWQEEYQRKEVGKRTKELQGEDEDLYMEIATKILKGPRKEVSPINGYDINVTLCATKPILAQNLTQIKSSSLITIKSLRKSQFKFKIKQVLFEIFQKTEDYIDVPQRLCDIKQMKML